ncbi:MAG UNVERIFIED_CONTAM: toprim domain-containing protein [Rickettsiaceae bacterium]|jgi:DNA primase
MPKYLNSPESIVFRKSETLYGEEIATGPAYQKKRIIIVEGYIDVIAMHNAGFLETVATLGTAVTKDHLNKLWRIADEVIFCLDGDRAGQNAMKKAINLVLPLLTNYKKASFLILPNKLDPDDVIKQFGREYIEKLIEKRIATSEMIWHLETINKKFDNPESRAALEIRLLQYAQLVQSETLKNYIKRDIKNKMWNFGRNTSKNSKKVLVKNNILENIGSEKEIIAYNLCAMIMAHPDLLNDEKTQDAFMNLEFTNTLLTDLQSFLIELHSRHKDINFDLIKEKMQKSRFSDLFVLLSSDNTSFIDKLSLDNETNTVLWALYLKKYELELLKEEYSNIIKSDQKNGFDKAMAYLKEIEKIEVDIKELSETL